MKLLAGFNGFKGDQTKLLQVQVYVRIAVMVHVLKKFRIEFKVGFFIHLYRQVGGRASEVFYPKSYHRLSRFKRTTGKQRLEPALGILPNLKDIRIGIDLYMCRRIHLTYLQCKLYVN